MEHPSFSGLPRRIAGSSRARQWAIVLGVLVVLEAVVFGSQFAGLFIPPFDFMGSYNVEAYSWWRNGSFFDPPQWMPYMYGGYPALSNIQNSSFYLPVGIAAIFGPYTLHAAAIVSALHVAFGALGVYVLARRWNLGFSSALIGLVLWFFVTGFYSSAVYVDFQRSYAWIPWIFLITSVKWNWRHPWAASVGTLFLWQAILGMYPGMLVAMAYTVPVWIVANQVASKPKITRYLLPLAFSAISAVAMSLLRFLPAIMERGAYPAVSSDTSQLTIASLGTFLFPYANPALLWIPSMQALFLPAIALPVLAFLAVRATLVRMLISVVTVAVALGVPNLPWHDLVTLLPGMTASRFRFSDFKLIILLCVCLLVVASLSALIERANLQAQAVRTEAVVWERTRAWIGVSWLLAINVVFAVIAVRYDFDAKQSLPQWLLLAVSSIAVAFYALRTHGDRPRARLFATSLAVIALASGLLSVTGGYSDWGVDRIAAEKALYGATVDSLIEQGESASVDERQRPQRVEDAIPDGVQQVDMAMNRLFYSDQGGVEGYVNLRGTETFELIKQQLNADGVAGYNTRAFWEAPGMVIEGPADTIPVEANTDECAADGVCGVHLQAHPVSYDPDGVFVYDLAATSDISVMLNEAGYVGWKATLCRSDELGDCRDARVERGSSGQITLPVPAGTWRLDVHYELPGAQLAWAIFAGSVLAVLLMTALTVSGNRRRRPAMAQAG